jgi:predicted permease
MSRRALDLLLRLFPAHFRERHARQVRELLDETLRREPDAARRSRLLRRALLDTLRTLVRAWLDIALGRTGSGAGLRGSLAQDAGFAIRHLRRRPLRTVTLVGTLAFALGSATAIASVTHAILIRTLPYEEPERVFSVDPPPARFTTSGPSLRSDFTESPEVERAALYVEDGAGALGTDDGSPARRIRVAQVSEDFFATLGVTLIMGGGLGPADDEVDRIVLSHELWRSAFGGDPGIVGRPVRLNERPLTVVGVTPPEVGFPGGTDAWLPHGAFYELYGAAFGSSVIARLRPNASAEALRLRLQQAEAAQWDNESDVRRVTLRPLRDELTRGLRTPLVLLAAASGMVLALACLNLAGIEFAGVAARLRELGVRAALGASRGRIARQLLTESLVLAAAGGTLGLTLAVGGVRVLQSLLPGETPGLAAAGLDLPALVTAAVLTMGSGLLIGVLPALRAGGPTGPGAGGPATTGSREGRRMQAGMVVAQVSLAVILAGGAGLLGGSLSRLHDQPVGYSTSGVLTFEVRFPDARADDRAAYLRAVRERVLALPGVLAVGASDRLPLADGMGVGGRARPAGMEDAAVPLTFIAATDGWLEAMGVARLAGSDLPPAFGAERGVVLSRSAADSLFGAESALGRMVEYGFGSFSEPAPIVGVVDDLRLGGGDSRQHAILFTPYTYHNSFGFAVRTADDPEGLVPAVRAILDDVDARLPGYAFRTTGSALASHLAARTAVARLASLFGAVALLLASLGLYGLVARGILARRRELGVRLALGASPRRLLGRTVAGGLMLGGVGIALGLAVFLPLASRMEALLFQVDARDPRILGPIVALVLLVTIVATWIPARATTRIEPRDALSAEG